jgi:peroxiredoxin
MGKLTLTVAVLAVAVGLFIAAHRRPGTLSLHATFSRQEPAPLAPELSLTDLDGRTLSPSSLSGKVVVVNFWAAWCGPCAREVPEFVALQGKYQDQGLQVIGVSIDDSASELRTFCRRTRMNYPVVVGSQSIAQAYGGILGLPTTLIINREGRVQRKLTGSTDFASLEQEVAGLLKK